MLYVTVVQNGISESIQWHVGEYLGNQVTEAQILDVVSVMADCDELDLILRSFVDLPYAPSATINQWFGDQAKQIVSWLLDRR